MDRRDFLKIGGVSTAGTIGCGFPLLCAAARVLEGDLGCGASVPKQLAMVIDIGRLKEGDYARVRGDLAAVVEAAGGRAVVKAILETGLWEAKERRWSQH